MVRLKPQDLMATALADSNDAALLAAVGNCRRLGELASRGRTDAVNALRGIGDDEALSALIEASRSVEAASGLVAAIAAIGGDAARRRLIELANELEVPDEEEREASNELSMMRALETAGEVDRAVAIASDVAVDRRIGSWEREAALRALGALASPQCAEVLALIASDLGEDEAMRGISASALGQVPGDPTLACLSALIDEGDTPDFVRQCAAEALGDLGETGRAVEVLKRLAGRPSCETQVRVDAASALGKFGEVDMAVRVLATIARRRVGSARASAVKSLGQLDARRLPELAGSRTLSSDVLFALAGAYASAGQIPDAIDIYIDLAMRRTGTRVSRESIAELGRLGGRKPTRALIELASDSRTNSSVRYFAAYTVASMEAIRTDVEPLLALALDPDMRLWERRMALQAIAKVGGQSALEALTQLSEDGLLRSEVLHAVEQLAFRELTNHWTRGLGLVRTAQASGLLPVDHADSLGKDERC